MGGYDVRRYFPGDHGSVLITTRLSRLAQLGDSTQLKGVDEQQGKAIFQQWRGAELGEISAVYKFGLVLIGRSHGRGWQRAARSARRPSTRAGTGCFICPRDRA